MTKWYLARMFRIPTNFNPLEMVAIEAKDFEQAKDRLWKIYGQTHHTDDGDFFKAFVNKDGFDSVNADELYQARKHPLPK